VRISLKSGSSFTARNSRNNDTLRHHQPGTFTFNNGYTQANPVAGDNLSGDAFRVISSRRSRSRRMMCRSIPLRVSKPLLCWIFQDDWRVNNRLTHRSPVFVGIMSRRFQTAESPKCRFRHQRVEPVASPRLHSRGGLLFTGNVVPVIGFRFATRSE